MYYRPNTTTVFQTHAEIRAAFPDVFLPAALDDDVLAGMGIFPVRQVAAEYSRLHQSATESAPVLIDGEWTQQWVITVLDDAAIATNLAQYRAESWERIKSLRENKTQNGGYQAAGKWFHSDTFSRSQQLGLVMMGASIPAGLQWKTMDGSFIAMTPALAQQVFQAAATQDGAIFRHAEQLKSWIDESSDPEVIDINAGWPETFGGV